MPMPYSRSPWQEASLHLIKHASHQDMADPSSLKFKLKRFLESPSHCGDTGAQAEDPLRLLDGYHVSWRAL
jgi:hypothetical protein